jgi:hypothetical protein
MMLHKQRDFTQMADKSITQPYDRGLFAALILSGIVLRHEDISIDGGKSAAQQAVTYADALIKALRGEER